MAIELTYATDMIWSDIDPEKGLIGLRVDEGESGVLYFTPEHARQVVKDFNELLTSFDGFDNQTEG